MTDPTRDAADAARPGGHDLREGRGRAAARSSRPSSTCPSATGTSCCRSALRRASRARLPEVSEPEIVRHYMRLAGATSTSTRGFYPLGSCTMKHNPKLHERVAALPGHARLHPLQDPSRAQGALRADVEPPARARRDRRPAARRRCSRRAGSHGELAGRAADARLPRGRAASTRTKVLTPDTAHGTNPATVTMAGYEVVKVGTNADGGVDVEDLRAKADDDVACLMLTNPNTLGRVRPRTSRRSPRSCTASARRSTTTARTSTR